MKSLQDKIEAASGTYVCNKGIIEGTTVFENVRKRWAANDFKAGANFTLAELLPILRECREALVLYDETGIVKRIDELIGEKSD